MLRSLILLNISG